MRRRTCAYTAVNPKGSCVYGRVHCKLPAGKSGIPANLLIYNKNRLIGGGCLLSESRNFMHGLAKGI